jgi:hypothetical protein
VAVNDLDCVFVSGSAVTVRRLDPGHRHAPGRRQFLAAGTGEVSGRNPGRRKRQDHASWPAIQDVIT